MTWALIADSSCNLRDFKPTAPDTVYAYAPLKINLGGTEHVDDASLDSSGFVDAMVANEGSSSSACPSVGEWAELFRLADNVIAVPISSNLSGSFDAANTARDLVLSEGERNIHIIDSHAAGGKMELIVTLLDRYLTNHPNCTFDELCAYGDCLEAKSQVLYSLSHFENLLSAGRLSKLAVAAVNKLSIRILGTATPQGTMKLVGPTRGEKKMYAKVVSTMESDGFEGGEVFIDHVNNESGAKRLADKIKETWNDAVCHILPCGGLCSYYAEVDGLIIGYGWGAAAGK